MRLARIALLSAATCLLPFATPAIAQVGSAELGHPTGCAQCSPVTINPWGTRGGPELRIGFPPGAVALAPETGVAAPPLANRYRVETSDVPGSYYPRYTTVRP